MHRTPCGASNPCAPFFFQLPAPYYGFGQTARDASGNYLAQAPKWKENLGASYLMDVGFGKLAFDTNVSITSKYYWTPDNTYATKGYALWDGSIAFTPGFDENLGVRVWGKNLTGHKYPLAVNENSGANTYTRSPAPPRTYGVEVSYKF